MKGEGNQQDYGMRIYDSRLGKFLSVDPLSAEYPWNSTYAFAENDVIRSIDLDGAEKHVRTFAFAISNGKTVSKVISNDYVEHEGTINLAYRLGLPITPEETVADGFIRAQNLPDNGTFSFFVFAPEIGKDNYARYEYTDAAGKQQVRYFDAGYIDFMYEHFAKEQQQADKILNLAAAHLNLVASGALLKAELKAASGEFKAATTADGVGAMRRLEYEAAPYHGKVDNAVKNRAPINGQSALDMSLQIKETSTRRIGIDYEKSEFVVFDEHTTGKFHGHVRAWEQLDQDMKKTLIKSGMTNDRGKILTKE